MKARIIRKTKETQVDMILNLRGSGKYKINTSIPFLDHMLSLFVLHGGFDLKVNAKGDIEVDEHHLVEDIGIVLGMVLKKALKNKAGIHRYGNFLMPMDEALSYVVIDISSRPNFSFESKFKKPYFKFDFDLVEDFFQAFTMNAGINLQISAKKGRSNHHIAESIFKGFGKALAQAVSKNPRFKKLPSTKGKL